MPWTLCDTGGLFPPQGLAAAQVLTPSCSFDGSNPQRPATHALGTAGATSADMVRLNVALNAASARRAHELLDAFRFLVMGTRVESGCLGCSTWVDPDWTVHYLEEWATEAHMRRRVCSDGFTSLLAVMESGLEPQVQFDFVTGRRGLDYVSEVRASAGP
jgi:quinol monooxygenase YgiN